MAHITLTYRCNLRCPYCFANEFVNKESTDITWDGFKSAVDFITTCGKARIGLIGGEPLVHPLFDEFVDFLINRDDVSLISIFTNGVLMQKHLDVLRHPKVDILVNCNSPEQIGEKAYTMIVNALDELVPCKVQDSVSLGFNLHYANVKKYEYALSLLQRYNMDIARIALAIPDAKDINGQTSIEFFKQRKSFLMQFYHKLDAIGVIPNIDCNVPPKCIWNKEETVWLKQYAARFKGIRTNIIGQCSSCEPVVDILPNLQAIRCFGLSDNSKVSICDFHNIEELENYYSDKFDKKLSRLPCIDECRFCEDFILNSCMGGCLTFKR